MEVSAEVERAMTAGRMFRGSRDFFLAYELLAAFHASAEVRSARAPSPIQSKATCAALALELALKARVVLDGGKPPSRGPDGHRYSAIFGLLSQDVQNDICSFLYVNGQSATPGTLRGSLLEFEGTFQTWRYMHEHNTVAFQEGNMIAVINATYSSIVRLRPDFGPWPGVIVDPNHPSRWHLTPQEGR